MNYTPVYTTLTDGIVGQYYEILKKNFYERIDVEKHADTYVTPKDEKCAEPEFTGKFIDVCTHYANSDRNEAALKKAKVVMDSILKNQRADGYLGCLETGKELAYFSVWNQAFTLLGMLSYAQMTGDEAVFAAAKKCTQYLYDTFITEGKDILDSTNDGTQHISILYSMVRLWELTGFAPAKALADHIIEKCEASDMNIVSFTDILHLRSQKGIEMIVIYLGLIRYGIVFDKPEMLSAAKRYWQQINDTQIRNTGNGTVEEFWRENGNAPVILDMEMRPNENCVAVGWIELSLTLFWTEPQAKYLDAIEKTFFNHVLGSVSADGSDFAYYQSNVGKKNFSTSKDMYKCCRYRGFTLFSCLRDMLYYEKDDVIIPVIYAASKYETDEVKLICETQYPKNGAIRFSAETKKAKTLRLRVPNWCDGVLCVNGESQVVKSGFVDVVMDGKCEIELKLDFAIRTKRVQIEGEHYLEYHCGPLLLAMDTCFGGSLKDAVDAGESLVSVPAEGFLQHFVVGDIHLVDYASAGRRNDSSYSVWIPEK
ncbi:MAG: glycoside hydrolase family 127 protein [Clostridia bacterium]|nr:glycoside hydrolase family 127 protein [Clostridia bacterium]